MAEIRPARPEDAVQCVNLAEQALGGRRGAGVVQNALDRGALLVADEDGAVVGALAYRTDWFACTLVTFVGVRADRRRRGLARALYGALEAESPGPRVFSTAPETDAAAIQMHVALGFVPSGFLDNLPQGHRELVFYKRLRPVA